MEGLPTKRRTAGRHGFVLVATALLFVVLLAFAGLAVDVGYVLLIRQQAQTAADAAAIGGLLEWKKGGDPAAVAAAGRADAALNGFADDTRATRVRVNRPPADGAWVGNPEAVEAEVTRTVPTMLIAIVGPQLSTIRARAVAKPGSTGPTLVE